MPGWEMIQIISLVGCIFSNMIGNTWNVKQNLGVQVISKLTCSATFM